MTIGLGVGAGDDEEDAELLVDVDGVVLLLLEGVATEEGGAVGVETGVVAVNIFVGGVEALSSVASD